MRVCLITLFFVIFTLNTALAKRSTDVSDRSAAVQSYSSFVFNGRPGTLHPQIQLANVFGKNDRVTYNDEDIIHQAIINKVGRLNRPNGKYCTATLVWKNLILTAAHCIANETKDAVERGLYTFCIGLLNGKCRASSRVRGVAYGTLNPERDGRSFDYAVLRIEDALGDPERFGYMGTQYVGNLDGTNVSIAGYGHLFEEGRRITIQNSCQLRGFFRKGLAYHDCDSARRDSGAPVFICNQRDCRIVGLNVSERRGESEHTLVKESFSEEFANLLILSEWFTPMIEEEIKKQAEGS